ncbi:MAG: hypothetical protein D6B25_06610 [Desulfobulbaceae bacterium]|nr:MAG: hypothetical protein D6B25_06610 [Desulfobulbaceae bacterium]
MTKTAHQVNRSIRLRAPILGLLLSCWICLVTPLNNIYHKSTPLGGGHFPLAPFFIFFILAILISLLAWLFRRRVLLSGSELLLIWIQMVIGSGIAYTGFARTFLINLTAPIHFATVSNQWEGQFLPLLPARLMPDSNEAITLLYNGIPGGRSMGWLETLQAIPWSPWVTPLLQWALFLGVSYFLMICIINLLSRQWILNERLNFPLLKVPQLIGEAIDTGGIRGFLGNRFLLVGLAIPLCLHLMNGLNLYYPSIPHLPTVILAGSYFPKEGFLSGFYKLKIYLYPAFIGFAFLASRQISFSFWFFFLLGGLVYGTMNMLGYTIPASELGITFGPTLTKPEEMQMIGAYGVFFFFLIWLARHHLTDVTKQSFLMAPPGDKNPVEWFDVRISFWGTVAGALLLAGWFNYQGVSWTTALLLVASFFMISVVVTRIICQGGLAYFTLTAAPMDGISSLFGTKFLGGTNGLLGAMSQKVLFVDFRESLMPSLLHSKSVTAKNHNVLLVVSALALTIGFAVISSLVAMMALCYRFGIRELDLEWASRTTLNVYENAYRLVTNPVPSGDWVHTFIIVGVVVMIVLVLCYQRLYWWPLHPIGYLTAYSSAMRILWVSFFFGWLFNTLCMKYGGVQLFRKMQLFFIGMIIGDFLMGGIWAIIGQYTYTSYMVLPD